MVVACLGKGMLMYHEGPLRYAYFSKDQAEGLAKEINIFKEIDNNYWNDGSFCDMSIRDMEDEYYNRNA